MFLVWLAKHGDFINPQKALAAAQEELIVQTEAIIETKAEHLYQCAIVAGLRLTSKRILANTDSEATPNTLELKGLVGELCYLERCFRSGNGGAC